MGPTFTTWPTNDGTLPLYPYMIPLDPSLALLSVALTCRFDGIPTCDINVSPFLWSSSVISPLFMLRSGEGVDQIGLD